MKKTLFVLFALMMCAHFTKAQTPHIEMSEPFDEPEEGNWNKLLQLKNGNTFYFHFTKKDGIEVTVYDKNRKQIASNTLTSNLWEPGKMKESKIEGLYEINGEPVIFLHQLLNRTPTLFRLRLNPDNGKLVEEKLMGTIQRYGAFAGYAMALGHVSESDFFIEKDPRTDCYGVVYFNGFAHESGERIKVEHYNGEHKLINSAYYDAPDGQYKYLRFIAMTVEGDRNIFLAVYGFNTQASGGDDSRVIISKLSADVNVFKQKILDNTEDFKNTTATMTYNPGRQVLQLLTLTYLTTKSKFFSHKSTSTFLPLITDIDPMTLSVTSSQPLAGEKVSEYMKANLDQDDGFNGIPQTMVINKDNTTTILSEESETKTIVDSRTGTIMSEKTLLSNIGISELDANEKELYGYGILKSQQANGYIPNLYLSEKDNGYWYYQRTPAMQLNNNPFLSFDYVNTNSNRYIIFNDYPDNFDKDEKKKRKTVTTISDANTIYYVLNNGQMTKHYLFGEPESDRKSKFSYIASSDYLQNTNTYATIIVERDGRDKQARIAWVKFD
ncbi:MAG TPA: hypothetical protein VN721_14570 [Flavipsychrobacter sp.]|nr:hypothetical protein [Flavipsychrobacter sp.]